MPYSADDCIHDIATFLDERNAGKRTDESCVKAIKIAVAAFFVPGQDDEESE